MGTKQSKVGAVGRKGLDPEKSKVKSRANSVSGNFRQDGRDSMGSRESSDNESFSLVVKHKTHNISLKKGVYNPNTIHPKHGNNNFDWDSVVKIMNTEINDGLVIIREQM